MKRLLLGLILVLMCGCTSLSTGKVIGKEYHESYVVIVPTYCGKNCTMYLPMTQPERWEIQITDGQKKDWKYVTQQDFNTYKIGDQFPSTNRQEGWN